MLNKTQKDTVRQETFTDKTWSDITILVNSHNKSTLGTEQPQINYNWHSQTLLD
jgi:hypothetical protein